MLRDTSHTSHERAGSKAEGAEKPACTMWYMRISSTAERGNLVLQNVSRGAVSARFGALFRINTVKRGCSAKDRKSVV